MNCWRRFDFKSVILFAGYVGERTTTCRRELERVGLYPDVAPIWTATSPADKMIAERAFCTNMVRGNLGFVNSLMAHYRAVKCAWTVGAKRVLVMEDDIRFLKDDELLQAIVESMPEDTDVGLLDWWFPAKATDADYAELAAAESVATFWKPFRNLRSAACYTMSACGMRAFMKLVEDGFTGAGKLRITDQYWPHLAADPSLKCYCAWPCAAVQGWAGTSADGRPQNLSNMEKIWKRYNKIGIERKRYAE